MTSSAAQRYALIAEIAHCYRKAFNRPPGKKALQKLFYILQRRSSEFNDYPFSFYNYGVYSHDLARDISDAERYDFLHIDFDEASNAYSITTTSDFETNRRFLPSTFNADMIGDVVSRPAKELELITTIMFVCEEEGISEKSELISRVKTLKPKFSEAEIKANIRKEFCNLADTKIS